MDRLNVDVNQIGGYSVAYQAGQTFQIIAVAIGKVYAPILQKTYANNVDRPDKGHFHVRNLLFFCSSQFSVVYVPDLHLDEGVVPYFDSQSGLVAMVSGLHRDRDVPTTTARFYSSAVSLLFFTERTSSPLEDYLGRWHH